ncbi:DUF6261 family protein [Marinifilum fragile]|uniref:DUF6261 family protein n=1 Tax=Marinifilum fragile TaxID=570161 RepID=UPI002AAAD326|nr:DUF6261 family protein [Marinifilum fragile]
MIEQMNFSKLHLNEFLSYCGEISTYLKSIDKEGLQIVSAIDQFAARYELAVAVSNRARSSKFTDMLKAKDHRRDESFLAFRNLVEACSHRKNATTAEKAESLLRIIRSHGWSLQIESRADQSAKMASLIKELSSAENTSLIEQLSATDWYQDMVDDNAEYLKQQEDKTVAESSETEYDTLEVYKNLRVSCEQLFEGIEVLNRIAPNDKYDQMEAFINDCTQRYQTIVKTRTTKNENAKEEQTQEQEA